jgi:molybdopterin converting factor small subunit
MKQSVVSVQFFGVQRALTQTSEILVPLLKGACVRDVLRYIMKAYPDLQLREEDMVVTVNNCISPISRTLNPNDRVAFLPHIGGG